MTTPIANETNSGWHKPKWSLLLMWIAICLGIGVLEGLATAPSVTTWYQTLNKPSFNPPDWVFGPVWTILYFMMAIAAWRACGAVDDKRRVQAIVIFCIQLSFNALWSFVFFSWHLVGYALIDILLLWATLILTIIIFMRIDRLSACLLIPYWVWVTFASLLNWQIWRLNP